mgnify:CR=1 FL=1
MHVNVYDSHIEHHRVSTIIHCVDRYCSRYHFHCVNHYDLLCLVWTPSFLFAKLNLLSLFPRFPSGCADRALFGAGCAALVCFLILVLVLVFLIAACRAAVPLLAAAPLLRPAGARPPASPRRGGAGVRLCLSGSRSPATPRRGVAGGRACPAVPRAPAEPRRGSAGARACPGAEAARSVADARPCPSGSCPVPRPPTCAARSASFAIPSLRSISGSHSAVARCFAVRAPTCPDPVCGWSLCTSQVPSILTLYSTPSWQ